MMSAIYKAHAWFPRIEILYFNSCYHWSVYLISGNVLIALHILTHLIFSSFMRQVNSLFYRWGNWSKKEGWDLPKLSSWKWLQYVLNRAQLAVESLLFTTTFYCFGDWVAKCSRENQDLKHWVSSWIFVDFMGSALSWRTY